MAEHRWREKRTDIKWYNPYTPPSTLQCTALPHPFLLPITSLTFYCHPLHLVCLIGGCDENFPYLLRQLCYLQCRISTGRLMYASLSKVLNNERPIHNTRDDILLCMGLFLEGRVFLSEFLGFSVSSQKSHPLLFSFSSLTNISIVKNFP